MSNSDKGLVWIASTLKDLSAMPSEVKTSMGYAVRLAQQGDKAENAVQMMGNLREVMEIRTNDQSGDSTYRVMYTIKLGNVV